MIYDETDESLTSPILFSNQIYREPNITTKFVPVIYEQRNYRLYYTGWHVIFIILYIYFYNMQYDQRGKIMIFFSIDKNNWRINKAITIKCNCIVIM